MTLAAAAARSSSSAFVEPSADAGTHSWAYLCGRVCVCAFVRLCARLCACACVRLRVRARVVVNDLSVRAHTRVGVYVCVCAIARVCACLYMARAVRLAILRGPHDALSPLWHLCRAPFCRADNDATRPAQPCPTWLFALSEGPTFAQLPDLTTVGAPGSPAVAPPTSSSIG